MPRPRRLPRARQSIHATTYSKRSFDSDVKQKKSSRFSKRSDSTSTHGHVTGRNWSSAEKIKPVRPSPPHVAANQSALTEGEHRIVSPDERTNSISRTCRPNVPHQ